MIGSTTRRAIGQRLSQSKPGAAKVAAMAEAAGYGSEAAFNRALKKCVGMAPGAWRLRNAT